MEKLARNAGFSVNDGIVVGGMADVRTLTNAVRVGAAMVSAVEWYILAERIQPKHNRTALYLKTLALVTYDRILVGRSL